LIRVVDMVMGAGKSSAAITYMNEHPEKRFLYVTPFLDETERIATACKDAHFVTPSGKIAEYAFAKGKHLRSLIHQRANVSLTHALFTRIDDDTAAAIADQRYTIIIDEAIDVFKDSTVSAEDIDMLVAAGYLEADGDNPECRQYHAGEKTKTYNGVFNETFSQLRCGQIVQVSGQDGGQYTRYGFWEVNRRLFALSEEIFILTYMFDGTQMCGFLASNHIPYTYIGVRKEADGKYRFAKKGVLPEYIAHLRDMIHVCDKESINKIGDAEGALSATWMRSGKSDGRAAALGRHIDTFFRRHVPQDAQADDRLWTTYLDGLDSAKGKRANARNFLAFNSRATNSYGDRSALAFCVNIYMNPFLYNYLKKAGVEVSNDRYALGVMVQWIWRSRIRNGQEIWVYIPSRRMRQLFLNWLDDLEAAYWKEQEVRER